MHVAECLPLFYDIGIRSEHLYFTNQDYQHVPLSWENAWDTDSSVTAVGFKDYLNQKFTKKRKFSLFRPPPPPHFHFFGGGRVHDFDRYPLPSQVTSPWQSEWKFTPLLSPAAYWDTSQVLEDFGTIHKVQRGLSMLSGKLAVKLQNFTANFP